MTLPSLSSSLVVPTEGEVAHVPIGPGRKRAGRMLIIGASLLLALALIAQTLHTVGAIAPGFATWRPVLYAYLLWAVALGAGQVMIRGERGQKALFLLPALLFTVAVVIFPTLFGLYIAFTDWNLSSLTGRHFNGLDNLRQLVGDSYFWNALANMGFYVLSVLGQYAVAFGLALLLNADIKARKFFRVVFLIPLMLSPVAVSWMIGKSIMEYRYGPLGNLFRDVGLNAPAFFSTPWLARVSLMAMDAWTYIPFLMILLLAGLQALAGRDPRGGAGRRRQALAELLADHLPADAAGQRHGAGAQDHLRTEARRRRHQHHLGRPGRGDRHRVELRLSHLPRPLERRLRHDDRRGLSRGDHRVHDASAQPDRPLDAPGHGDAMKEGP